MAKVNKVKVPAWQGIVVAMDLGDRRADVVVQAWDGNVLWEGKVAMTRKALPELFRQWRGARVMMEAGTHSPWVDRLAWEAGCESVVVNPRRVRLIAESTGKSDQTDAAILAFLGRVGLGILSPVIHRSEQMQLDMAVLSARELLVKQRTAAKAKMRSIAKSLGLRRDTWEYIVVKGKKIYAMPAALQPALGGLQDEVTWLDGKIKQYDRKIEEIIKERYPEARLLQEIPGVGPITSLTAVLTFHTPERFANARVAGAYVGLVPARRQSGKRDPQLGITKAGDNRMRMLAVQCAQHILSRESADSDLRRSMLKKGEGGKVQYRKAVIALARKLVVLMLHLLMNRGECYERFREAGNGEGAQGGEIKQAPAA